MLLKWSLDSLCLMKSAVLLFSVPQLCSMCSIFPSLLLLRYSVYPYLTVIWIGVVCVSCLEAHCSYGMCRFIVLVRIGTVMTIISSNKLFCFSSAPWGLQLYLSYSCLRWSHSSLSSLGSF